MSKDWARNEHGKVNDAKHLNYQVKNYYFLDYGWSRIHVKLQMCFVSALLVSEKLNIQLLDLKSTVHHLLAHIMILKMFITSPYCEAVAPFAVASIG